MNIVHRCDAGGHNFSINYMHSRAITSDVSSDVSIDSTRLDFLADDVLLVSTSSS